TGSLHSDQHQSLLPVEASLLLVVTLVTCPSRVTVKVASTECSSALVRSASGERVTDEAGARYASWRGSSSGAVEPACSSSFHASRYRVRLLSVWSAHRYQSPSSISVLPRTWWSTGRILSIVCSASSSAFSPSGLSPRGLRSLVIPKPDCAKGSTYCAPSSSLPLVASRRYVRAMPSSGSITSRAARVPAPSPTVSARAYWARAEAYRPMCSSQCASRSTLRTTRGSVAPQALSATPTASSYSRSASLLRSVRT